MRFGLARWLKRFFPLGTIHYTKIKEITIPVVLDSDTTPLYLGVYTTLPAEDDGQLVNDYLFDGRTASNGGGVVRYWTGSTWTEMTSADNLWRTVWGNTFVLSDAAAWANEQDDEVAAANAIFTNLFAINIVSAFILAKHLKIQTGGSLQGGDRYAEDGSVADGTKPGFFIGASGACKLAGVEFEGSQGGGVQWSGGQQVGDGLALGVGVTGPAMGALSDTDVAVVSAGTPRVSRYHFNASTRTFTSLGYRTIGGEPTGFSVAVLTSTDIVLAVTYLSTTNLVYLRWNSTTSTFDQISSTQVYSYSGTNYTAWITALNATDIAYYNPREGLLRVYRFSSSGASVAAVGSGTSISSSTMGPMCALSGTDIVASHSAGLYAHRWDSAASSWSSLGSLSLSSRGWTAVAALNATDIATIGSSDGILKLYRWSGSTFAELTNCGSVSIGSITSNPAMAALNGTDIVLLDDTNRKLSLYRYAFALSKPWRYPFSG